METLFQDVRHGFRMLMKNPGFTAVAVITLALGIGANTAVFSVVNAVLLRPLPFDSPDRVMSVSEVWQGQAGGGVSAGNFIDWQQASRAMEQLAAAQVSTFNLGSEQTPERIIGDRVTHNFFSVFAVSPLLGRAFIPEEDQPGSDRVVVLSERLWRRNFGSDRSILGRMVQFDGSARTVIGVMPANFDPIQNREELWVPIAFTPERRAQHDEHAYMVFGRLKPGVGLQQAQSEMDIVSKQQALKYPDENGDRGIRVTRLDDVLLGPFPLRPEDVAGSCRFRTAHSLCQHRKFAACSHAFPKQRNGSSKRFGRVAMAAVAAVGGGKRRTFVRRWLRGSHMCILGTQILAERSSRGNPAS